MGGQAKSGACGAAGRWAISISAVPVIFACSQSPPDPTPAKQSEAMTYGPYACGNNFDAPGDCSESSVCANAIPSQCWGACTYNGGGFRFYAAIVDGACTCMIECYDYNTQPSCGPGYWACQSDYDCPGDSPCNRSSGCCYYDQYYS